MKEVITSKNSIPELWQFAVISAYPYFYGEAGAYMVIYRSKDKNTTQDFPAEPVGSPAAPFWCK